jgi:hypothetical protein
MQIVYGIRNYAYLADGTNGIVIITKQSCKTNDCKHYYTTFAQKVVKSGNYAYIADDTSGLVILIEQCRNPHNCRRYNTAGHGYSVAVSGNYVYVAEFDNGLVILHVENASLRQSSSCYAVSDQSTTVVSAVNFDASSIPKIKA